MRSTLTYYFVMLILFSNAQFKTDSLQQLPQVEKVAASISVIKPTVYYANLQTKNLNDVLRENTGIYLKNYGNGQLSSIAFRGTGASQTDILWNGIKLNSPSLGQVDMSLFDMGMFEQLDVRGIAQSGNVGGEINMQNQSSYDSSFSAEAAIAYGSFNTLRAYGKTQFNNWKVSGASRISYLSSDNDYPFINTYARGNPKEKLSHAQVQLLSFMQQFGARINKSNSVQFNVWLSDAQRQIPPIISKAESKEKQDDYSLRTMALWKGDYGKLKTSFTSAFLHDVIRYVNPEIYLDEKSIMQAFRNNFSLTYDSLRNFSVQVEAGYDFERAMVPSYKITRTRNIEKLMLGLKYQPVTELYLQLKLREHIYDKSLSPFSPSLTFDYLKYFHQGSLGVTVNAARNFRYPTLNDLYWVPDGNPNLKVEESWDGELGARYSYRSYFYFKAVGFCKYVTNWIQWIPNGTYWQPQNVKRVLSTGAEATVISSYSFHDFNFKAWATYTYTHATSLDAVSTFDQSKGKQVIYVPFHVANTVVRIEYKRFFIRVINTYTDAVFTATDNSQKLKGYYLLDLEVGKDFLIKDNYVVVFTFKMNNVTDVSYQNVAQRPMPGRNFEGILRFRFNG